MTGTHKRKNNQDEGKQSNNNSITDGEHKVYGLVSFVNWNYTIYKSETEAENALSAMRSMGVSNSIKLMSASSKEGLVALIDNKKKQKYNQEDVGNNQNTEESAPAQVTPVKKTLKSLKVQKTVKMADKEFKLSVRSATSANPYLDHVQRQGIKFCVTIFTPDTPDKKQQYKCISVDLRDIK